MTITGDAEPETGYAATQKTTVFSLHPLPKNIPWKQLPDRILGSMSQEKRFTLEQVFWTKKEIRSGDKLYYEYFLIPLSGGNPEEAGKIFRSLTGEN